VFDDAITGYAYANSHVLVYPIPGLDGSVKHGAEKRSKRLIKRLFGLSTTLKYRAWHSAGCVSSVTRHLWRGRLQFDGNWTAGDPEFIFGLYGPGV
jgi:hypothetical protein